MKKIHLAIFFLCCLIDLTGYPFACASPPKLLYVNSYHKGYKWSDDIEKGLFKALNIDLHGDKTPDVSRSGIVLRIVRLDTKRNTSEIYKRNAGLTAKGIIETWHPDVVVASDDNASKYLVAPYFKNASIPFVFCGVNWDASVYGFPVANVTGMVEVESLNVTIDLLRPYARGDRIGYLGADEFTNRKSIPYHKRLFGIDYVDGNLVETFDQWKRAYARLQDAVDILICLNPIGISGWEPAAAMGFIDAHTRIPSGCTSDNMIQYVLLAQTSVAEEQGWWAGKTALRIIAGTHPADIPITRNQASRVYLNMRLAARLGIRFPIELVERATFVEDMSESE